MNATMSNPRPGELVINGSQAVIEEFVTNCECAGFKVTRPSDKPTPLGLPVYNFGREIKRKRKTKTTTRQQQPNEVSVRNDDKPVPLGLPRWEW